MGVASHMCSGGLLIIVLWYKDRYPWFSRELPFTTLAWFNSHFLYYCVRGLVKEGIAIYYITAY
jgi:hypothetical protein